MFSMAGTDLDTTATTDQHSVLDGGLAGTVIPMATAVAKAMLEDEQLLTAHGKAAGDFFPTVVTSTMGDQGTTAIAGVTLAADVADKIRADALDQTVVAIAGVTLAAVASLVVVATITVGNPQGLQVLVALRQLVAEDIHNLVDQCLVTMAGAAEAAHRVVAIAQVETSVVAVHLMAAAEVSPADAVAADTDKQQRRFNDSITK